MTRKTERWSRYGNVSVSRDARGRFVSWKRVLHKITTGDFGEKAVSVYGSCMTDEGVSERRFDIYGRGKELYEAVVQAHSLVPRERFVSVSAEDFLDDPFDYGTSGYWTEKPEVES